MFLREIMLQYQIRHPRILSVEAVSIMGDKIGMVTEFLTNGNLSTYLKTHPDANRLTLVRYKFSHSSRQYWFLCSDHTYRQWSSLSPLWFESI